MLSSDAQLRALLDVRYGAHLLGQFRSGATASEAARRLGEPAPRVTYHVGRLRRLGLLIPAPGPGRGQRLRPAARRFVVPPELAGTLGACAARPLLAALTDAFLTAPAQRQAPEGRELTLLDLDAGPRDVELTAAPDAAQLLTRVTRLTPAAYDRVLRAAWAAIAQEEQSEERGAQLFTLALMGFPGSPLPLAPGEAHRGD